MIDHKSIWTRLLAGRRPLWVAAAGLAGLLVLGVANQASSAPRAATEPATPAVAPTAPSPARDQSASGGSRAELIALDRRVADLLVRARTLLAQVQALNIAPDLPGAAGSMTESELRARLAELTARLNVLRVELAVDRDRLTTFDGSAMRLGDQLWASRSLVIGADSYLREIGDALDREAADWLVRTSQGPTDPAVWPWLSVLGGLAALVGATASWLRDNGRSKATRARPAWSSRRMLLAADRLDETATVLTVAGIAAVLDLATKAFAQTHLPLRVLVYHDRSMAGTAFTVGAVALVLGMLVWRGGYALLYARSRLPRWVSHRRPLVPRLPARLAVAVGLLLGAGLGNGLDLLADDTVTDFIPVPLIGIANLADVFLAATIALVVRAVAVLVAPWLDARLGARPQSWKPTRWLPAPAATVVIFGAGMLVAGLGLWLTGWVMPDRAPAVALGELAAAVSWLFTGVERAAPQSAAERSVANSRQ